MDFSNSHVRMRPREPDFFGMVRILMVKLLRENATTGILGEEFDSTLVQRKGVPEEANMAEAFCGIRKSLVADDAHR